MDVVIHACSNVLAFGFAYTRLLGDASHTNLPAPPDAPDSLGLECLIPTGLAAGSRKRLHRAQ